MLRLNTVDVTFTTTVTVTIVARSEIDASLADLAFNSALQFMIAIELIIRESHQPNWQWIPQSKFESTS